MRASRSDDELFSPATPTGQMRHLLNGVSRLEGRRRTAARIVCGLVLLVGTVAVGFGAYAAFSGALA